MSDHEGEGITGYFGGVSGSYIVNIIMKLTAEGIGDVRP